jgi:hypothetical protein
MRGNGGLAVATIVGMVLIVVIGWIPFIGAYFAGKITGGIAGSSTRGVLAVVLALAAGTIVLLILGAFMGSFLGMKGSILVTISLIGSIYNSYTHMGLLSIYYMIEIAILLVGGFLGGRGASNA